MRLCAVVCLLFAIVGGPPHDASAQGQARTYEEGLSAFTEGNLDRALQIWEPLAKSGHPVAQYGLGKIYATGTEQVSRDFVRAAHWYKKAAERGISAAQNNLGLLYSKGQGVELDPEGAAELWRKATSQGHPLAAYNLALAFYKGEGVAEDRTRAIALFFQAAEKGVAEAQFVLGQFYEKGVVFDRDEKQAIGWYSMAAEQGYRQAGDRLSALGAAPRETTGEETSVAAVGEPPSPSTGEPAERPPDRIPIQETPKQELREDEEKGRVEPEAAEPASKGPFRSEPPVQSKPGSPLGGPVAQPAERRTREQPDVIATGTPAATRKGETSPEPLRENTAATASKPAPPTRKSLTLADMNEAEAPDPAPEEAPEAAERPSEPVVIWLTSLQRRSAAEDLINAVRGHYADLFDGTPLSVDRRQHGGRTFFRIVAGPVPDTAAADLCRGLREAEPKAFCHITAAP